jgi:hypothetical protein
MGSEDCWPHCGHICGLTSYLTVIGYDPDYSEVFMDMFDLVMGTHLWKWGYAIWMVRG